MGWDGGSISVPDRGTRVQADAQGLGQGKTLHLVGRGLGDFVNEDESPRHLEPGQPIKKEARQIPILQCRSGPRDHRCRHFFAERGMGNRKGRGLAHIGVADQGRIDLRRADLLAPAVDHLLDPSGEGQIAVFIEKALVAGAEPAVRERHGAAEAAIQVPLEHLGAPQHDLSHLAGR